MERGSTIGQGQLWYLHLYSAISITVHLHGTKVCQNPSKRNCKYSKIKQ